MARFVKGSLLLFVLALAGCSDNQPRPAAQCDDGFVFVQNECRKACTGDVVCFEWHGNGYACKQDQATSLFYCQFIGENIGNGGVGGNGGNTPPACVAKTEVCNGVDDDCDGQVDESVRNACGGCGSLPSEVCDSVDNDCDGQTDENNVCGSTPTCIPTNEVCDGKDNNCNGLADEGPVCAPVTIPELCNGLDDDSDGFTDENVKNACGGCGAVPTEVCDGIDNNCNGVVDEGVTNACGGCGVVPTEVCDGIDNNCNGVIDEGFVKNACGGCGAPPVELCNYVDDDCDGLTDEGFTFSSDNQNCGQCGFSCVNSTCANGTCQTAPVIGCMLTASAEICDYIDNDCDGFVDDGFVLPTDEANCGVCGNACAPGQVCGQSHCQLIDMPDPLCVPNPLGEVCNYEDDDCDGLIDELTNKLNDIANCGSCGFSCATDAQCINAHCVANTPPDSMCVPAPELCDNKDNDCDGVMDEDFKFLTDELHCGICGVSCGLNQVCQNAHCEWITPVDDSCVPTAELCDNIDNDCDGAIDEDFILLNDSANCGTCGNSCPVDQMCWNGFCKLKTPPPSTCATSATTEVCDNVDNDCDGLVDEDFVLQTDSANCGKCGNACAAAQHCVNSHCVLDTPVPTSCVATAEVCNNTDDDCDGIVDEGINLLIDTNNCGVCGLVCPAGANCENGHCTTTIPPGTICVESAETCDFVDNDCDGLVDEDFNFSNNPLHCGVCGNACAATEVCANGHCKLKTPPPSTCTPGVELCNNIDDDCDGLVDEDFYLGSDQNNCGLCGYVCAAGQLCASAHCYWPAPVNNCQVTSLTELCDNIDNDCNDFIDEGFVLSSDEANCGTCGNVCVAGQVCENGACKWLYPVSTCTISAEVCDNVDNDCDQVIDDGFVLASDSTNCGICGNACAADQRCAASHCEWVTPVPTSCVAAPTEACNNADDDCDNVIDEGFNLLIDPANCGMCGLACPSGASCEDGHCTTITPPPNSCLATQAAESCDQVDNDCDGLVDEDFNVLDNDAHCGQCNYACPADQHCVAGHCMLKAPPPSYCWLTYGTEVCDQIDNDCDGLVDEDFNFWVDELNCGKCGNACNVATETCYNAHCVLLADPNSTCGSSAELCNNIDDDCDGLVDEDFNFAVNGLNCGACGVACVAGTHCESSHCVLDTKPDSTCQSTAELCDFSDNDCDGVVDEDFYLATDPLNCGACGKACDALTQTCDNSHCVLIAKPDSSCTPSSEACDYEDNDCDGEIDEDFNFLADNANCGLCGNACAADQHCVNAKCVLNTPPPTMCMAGPELCNNSDDDCDKIIDEGFNLLIDVNNCGLCGLVCPTGASCEDAHCTTITPPPSLCDPATPESCDQVDNDCDGFVDEDVNFLSDDAHCGQCNHACPGGQHCANGYCKLIAPVPDACQPVAELCDGIDNDCDQVIDENFDVQTDEANCGVCGNACDSGEVCWNARCVLTTPVSNACQPVPELCDGIDNDCDGMIDEDFNVTINSANCGICGNNCGPTAHCVASQCVLNTPVPGTCVPASEVCDSVDNDCDGLIDEGFDVTSDSVNCGRCGYVCAAGSHCEASHCVLDTPVASTCNPGAEACNNADDDCDGIFDEGFNTLNDVNNCGVCGMVCPSGASCETGHCTAIVPPGTVCIASAEACDNVDNDCDGLIDEDFNVLTNKDHCGFCNSVCGVAQHCVNGTCVLDTPPGNACVPSSESCDFGDNDCDGLVDEDFDFFTDDANCGACGNACDPASETCFNAHCVLLAPATTICVVSAEVCDGNDNDCDGLIDEDFDFATNLLHCGMCGNACLAGSHCVDSHCVLNAMPPTSCVPAIETCDYVDNDCDGLIDEDFDLANDPANCGQCGYLCDTNETCSGFHCMLKAVPNNCVATASAEVCDYTDNDCDALIDEGINRLLDAKNCGVCGRDCGAGAGCVAGHCALNTPASNCTPVAETCNNTDDDCDQLIDEGFNLLTDAKNCGVCGLTCASGANCLNGHCTLTIPPATICTPSTEVCDYADNDCDGEIDEGIFLQGDSANCGVCGNACAAGQHCVSARCELDAPAPSTCVVAAESCDSIDNDCDRLVDEDFDFMTNHDNCGECGNACAANEVCFNAHCTLAQTPTSTCLATQSAEICDFVDNDCDGLVDEDFDLATNPSNCGACGYVCGVGTHCEASHCVLDATPASSCVPAAETCNGIDDDCDGLVDEDFPLTTDAANCGQCGNACTATQVCVNAHCTLKTPTNGCVASAEVCDYIDNDCDMTIDEGINRLTDSNNCGICGRVCGANAGCVSGHCALNAPAASTCTPVAETCNNTDDDCDGLIDETFFVNSDPANCGSCGYVCGVGQTCANGHCANLTPASSTCAPSAEQCNNADDDCDGAIDEDFVLAGDALNCGICGNACAVDQNCVNSKCVWIIPSPSSCIVAAETCNNVDDDCDSIIDEGFNFLADINNCGLCGHACASGESCENGHCALIVPATTLCVPAPELCDGVDNDCDSAIDEDFNLLSDSANCGVCGNACGLGEYCAIGHCGLIAPPSSQCVSSVELCNGTDDDCDGMIDEDFILANDKANCGICGNACAANQVCVSAKCTLITPASSCTAVAEVCDNTDNDCDGIIDEGFNRLTDPNNCGICGRVCGTGIGCVNGHCVSNTPVNNCTPVAETCNNADDDCDLLIDEGFNLLNDAANCGMCGRACGVGASCVSGHCAWNVPASSTCSPSVETCDNVDNDCDGGIDEDFLVNSDPQNCGTCGFVCGAGETCANGHCANLTPASSTCTSSAELCDNVDNDCDGLIDEDFVLAGDDANCGICGNACAANQLCVSAHCEWQTPLSGCVASAETCNNVDDDCDMVIDEGINLLTDINNCGMCGRLCPGGASCENGHCALLVPASPICVPAPELCDGVDNDCDGLIDEDINVLTDSANCGVCNYACAGGQHCEASHCVLDAPVPGTCVAQSESCDNGDNDCDGQVDEDFNFTTDAANCGQCGNACAAGQLCVNAHCVLTAIPSSACAISAETCNFTDDDCDGLIDEDFDLATNPLNCGACGNACVAGSEVCVNGHCALMTPPASSCVISSEICNHEDDDCDGLIDEDFDLLIDSGNCGSCGNACGAGQNCVNAHCVLSATPPSSCAPSSEACNNMDDDCDGQIDEDFNVLTDAANCGACGNTCALGTEVCVNAHCVLITPPTSSCVSSPELCNYQDDDCDRVVDEDFQFLTDPANCGGCGFACAAGQLCVNGHCALATPASNCTATAEVCDYSDNDCDGLIDEGINRRTDALNCGICGRTCGGGQSCVNGHCVLNTPPAATCVPTAEVCDYSDNDCDGAIDEDTFFTTDAANCGFCGNACAAGQTCVNAHCAWTTPLSYCTPSAEVCDNADNNCNGTIDEGFNLLTDVNNCGKCGIQCPAASACINGKCLASAQTITSCTIVCPSGWFPRIWYGYGVMASYWQSTGLQNVAMFNVDQATLCSRPPHPTAAASAWFDVICQEVATGANSTFGTTTLVSGCFNTLTGNLAFGSESVGITVPGVISAFGQNQYVMPNYCP